MLEAMTGGVKWASLCITVRSLLRFSSGSVHTLQQKAGPAVHVNIKEEWETEEDADRAEGEGVREGSDGWEKQREVMHYGANQSEMI